MTDPDRAAHRAGIDLVASADSLRVNTQARDDARQRLALAAAAAAAAGWTEQEIADCIGWSRNGVRGLLGKKR